MMMRTRTTSSTATWVFANMLVGLVLVGSLVGGSEEYMSAVGDPGMRRDSLRVAIEAWNQCNEVHQEAPDMGSPRQADCFDVLHNSKSYTKLVHRVNEKMNRLGIANATRQGLKNIDVNEYAAWKERYLGYKCQVEDKPGPWQFWMFMLKSGNLDTMAAICPKNGKKSEPFPPESRFPCFGKGCMNMPRIYHDSTSVKHYHRNRTLREVSLGHGIWMLISDATRGLSGGYHYDTRGMTKIVPKSPNFKVKFSLDIKKGGGPNGQFYLMDIGSCWKNNGKPCDGDVTTDVTRYSEMIINPSIKAWCNPQHLRLCPPYHTFSNGTRVHRTDKIRFPYYAYHVYCSPGNGEHLESHTTCAMRTAIRSLRRFCRFCLTRCGESSGIPPRKARAGLEMQEVGNLMSGGCHTLYFYQDPGTKPVERHWPSINIGAEIYISSNEVAEWIVSDFDILVPKS
ncbi:hypothetical protein Sango_2586600 [Sesamum angolense]|uniref:DUF7705 domain-containing protein n=1 Tax=Sesamum angolense TaxID=2727404 RepID=A0AAE1W5G2_9LAMI|nr:hypothetical protein Sango_2586600 [Sesamum angolense]